MSSLLDQLRGKSIEEQFAALDEVSRVRALDRHESLKFEQVIREMDRRDGRGKRGR